MSESVAWTTCQDCNRVLTLAWVKENGPICPDCEMARVITKVEEAIVRDGGEIIVSAADAPKPAPRKKSGCCG